MDTEEIWKSYFEEDYDTVIRAGANAAEIMHVAGLSLMKLDRIDEAVTLLTSSLAACPNSTWYSNVCIALLENSQTERALPFAVAGVTEYPTSVNMLFNAASVFTALERFEDARSCLLKALSIDPKHWEAVMNLANTLRRLDELEGAIRLYDISLDLNAEDIPGRVRCRLNKAVTLSDMGDEAGALAILEELSAEGHVNSAEMDFNRATLLLKLGDFAAGWPLYERRWDCQMAAEDRAAFSKPFLTSLEEGRGKKVLLCHEQGFGDSIQFSRYAPLLESAGLNVTMFVLSPLERLFQESFDVPVVSSREGLDYDFELPMLSAPMLFQTTLETIPGRVPYLEVPKSLIKKHRLEGTGRLKVGIVWAGQAREAYEMKMIDKKRSCEIEDFKDLLTIDADFYSLQFGARALEILNISEDIRPKIVLEENFDFLDTAGVIENLDMVITVDTAVAHLSAALGKPTWLLSRFDGCWRWLKDRTDSPWYSPNLRIFHQKKRGEWKPVLDDVREELLKLI